MIDLNGPKIISEVILKSSQTKTFLILLEKSKKEAYKTKNQSYKEFQMVKSLATGHNSITRTLGSASKPKMR